jgi:hypothetical protein
MHAFNASSFRIFEDLKLYDYFKKQKDELSKIDDEKFKKISTNT